MTINQDLLLDIHQLRIQLREHTMTPTEACAKLTQLLVDHPYGMDLVPSLRELNERLLGELDTWLGSVENQNKPKGHQMFGSFDVDEQYSHFITKK